MNVENILKVAAAIEDAAKPDAKPEIGFNMSFFISGAYGLPRRLDHTGHNCGTACCIGGWALYLKDGGVPALSETMEEQAAIYLGLDPYEGVDLFYAVGRPVDLLFGNITPAHAVAVLRHLAETGIVDWTVGAPSETAPLDLSDDRDALASAGFVEGE